jgi:pimeloyl-ACP methyl ester carboxylesterase
MSTLPEVPADRWWWGRPLAELRWQLELARLVADPVFRGRGVPHGDGRPVVLAPGFLAGDYTLGVLGGWLRRIGYRPYTCGFVGNVDCSNRALARVEERVEAAHRRHGGRVALIGHSRGGHFVRALAARSPDRVSHGISLGADLRRMLGISLPTRMLVAGARTGVRCMRRADADDCFTTRCSCPFTHDYGRPFPKDRVRLTSIYSMGDGVVRPEGCVVPYARSVEVQGSHVGLVFNRSVYAAIATALAEPELA